MSKEKGIGKIVSYIPNVIIFLLILLVNYLFFQQTLQHRLIYESPAVSVSADLSNQNYVETSLTPQYSFFQNLGKH